MFEKSNQFKVLKQLDNNEDWSVIKEYVKVFVIRTGDIDLDKGPYPKNVDFIIEEYK